MVPRASLPSNGPNQLRKLTEVETIAGERHADETLAIAVMSSFLAKVDWKETHEHICIKRMSIYPGKVHISWAIILISFNRDELEGLIGILPPRLVGARRVGGAFWNPEIRACSA